LALKVFTLQGMSWRQQGKHIVQMQTFIDNKHKVQGEPIARTAEGLAFEL
jgi:hypothetical protein